MPFPAFLDACTLLPYDLTDLLLRLADAGTYRPLWSAAVLAEVERNLVAQLDVPPEKASRRVNRMREHFRDAEVTGYESLIPCMTNHPKDRHVLAAAVRADAAIIVTANLRDFPAHACDPYDIDVAHPDEFLLDQLDLYPEQTFSCLHALVRLREQPPETLAGYLDKLVKVTPKFCDQVRQMNATQLRQRDRNARHRE